MVPNTAEHNITSPNFEEDHYFYYQMASFLEKKGMILEAKKLYLKALSCREEPRDERILPSIYYHLAQIEWLLENHLESLKYCEQCLSISPNHKIILNLRKWILSENTGSSTIERIELRPSDKIPPFEENESIVYFPDSLLKSFMHLSADAGEKNPESSTLFQNFIKAKSPSVELRVKTSCLGDLNLEEMMLWKKNLRCLSSFHNKHLGERAFVLGNGPSLSIQDLEKLKGEVTFASNKIYLAFDETKWRPTYFGVEDHLVLENNYSNIKVLKEFPKLFSHLIMPSPQVDKGEYSFFLHHHPFYPAFPGFGTSFESGLFWGSSISYSFIQMAFIMGVRELYLLGMDFDFNSTGEEDEKGFLTSHGEVNHFHPKYRSKGEKWHPPNLHHQVKSFEKAKMTFQSHGGKIYNATRGGKLEVFERIDFDGLF